MLEIPFCTILRISYELQTDNNATEIRYSFCLDHKLGRYQIYKCVEHILVHERTPNP